MDVLVIKCGGSIIEELSEGFFESLHALHKKGFKLIFVHGGGPDINTMLKTYQIKPEYKNGLRKTTAEVLSVVELMLAGKSNRNLVYKLQEHGIKAVGLNGSDGSLLAGEIIDEGALGAVGRITNVNTELLELLLSKDICPVLTPISMTADGRKLNVNADMAAGAVAKAIGAEMCLFVTDVKGVLKHGQMVGELTEMAAAGMIQNGEIKGGMIPKVQTALSVLKSGVDQVMIVSGKEPFFLESKFIGTKFKPEEERILQ